MKIKKIVIVGLGLMGGSLAASCRKQYPKAKIIGITRSASARNVARRKKWIHQGLSKISSEIHDADLIVLCTPVNTFLKKLRALDRYLKSGAIVTDVGSVKGSVCQTVEKQKWKNLRFVGAHPMVGSHLRGIGVANPKLYKSGFTFLVRSKKTNRSAYRDVKSFWRKISKRVIEVSARDHDEIVSEISHLPHAVAVSLMLAVSPKSLRFASKGFRDSTRIAAGDPSIWMPIFEANQRALVGSLAHFERVLGRLRRALKGRSRGAKNLRKLLQKAQRRREQISF